ncbi:MAG: bifunctional hydroxymethylpyrimidine kinase/phosphomethylpyrimidine kinase [Nocardioides sp.]|nr:bifunctional hydroxymethylpyrimidine kinase/phosphomethylpyrimidine kinase [Nocardioides sp.]
MTTPLVALSIAGTDSGGAAGLAADLATFAALGAHGACAVTAVTAQDTTGVSRVVTLSADDVRAQVEAVLGDLPVGAVKTGMLGSAEIAAVVAGISGMPVVVDPVLTATSGARLGSDELVAAYREVVLPVATVTTPNRDEAVRLTGLDPRAPAVELAVALHALGPAVVLTGGDPDAARCGDVVVESSGAVTVLEHDTVRTHNDHGTGCTFSAALAVHLGNGADLLTATRRAQAFVSAALATSSTWELGRGRGPVAHVSVPHHQENRCSCTPTTAPSTARDRARTSPSRSPGSP